jgi:hypothetical protein
MAANSFFVINASQKKSKHIPKTKPTVRFTLFSEFYLVITVLILISLIFSFFFFSNIGFEILFQL